MYIGSFSPLHYKNQPLHRLQAKRLYGYYTSQLHITYRPSKRCNPPSIHFPCLSNPNQRYCLFCPASCLPRKNHSHSLPIISIYLTSLVSVSNTPNINAKVQDGIMFRCIVRCKLGGWWLLIYVYSSAGFRFYFLRHIGWFYIRLSWLSLSISKLPFQVAYFFLEYLKQLIDNILKKNSKIITSLYLLLQQ